MTALADRAKGLADRAPDPGEHYRSSLHDTRVAAALGTALGVTFTVCFATGLISHVIQNPVGWFTWPSRPAGLYRFTQGVHVATGMASIPLVVAKLWVVAPRFWARPAVRSAAHGVERLLLFPLVGGAVFLLVSGTLNTFKWYPWAFFFPHAHYWAAWIMIGGLIAHIGAKAALTWRSLRRGDPTGGELADRASGSERRWFLGSVAAGAGALTVATVGQTFHPLRGVSVLAPRDPDVGPQGIPINRTARSARVTQEMADAWTLRVTGRVDRELELTLADLQALPQHQATLPIACVEGWSASATWRGVRLRDLLELAGAQPGQHLRLQSLQARSLYRSSPVAPNVAADRDTLLALELNGEPLALDHGYPCRLIAPNRPGVLQTKWVNRVQVG
ncbi:molybdopterin-dependent oxidoreductase [Aquihabitans sp. McL0605]|uniref:molybdopterin-dependent oxidoreductase n=1 Tax=Aquihabitans sp. McL0605 TaxID=3415671 RepID=UPI003CE7D6C2